VKGAGKGAPALPEVTLSEHEGVRYLHLGTPWVQGAMRIARPRAIELDYVQRMLAALLWLPQEDLAQGRAVQLGLGAATLTRFTHAELGMDTTAIELNPQVILACRARLRLPADGPGLQVVCGDAALWVARPPRGYAASVRLLHVDLYDHEAAAPVLDDEAFYRRCRALLEPGGVMAVNLFGRQASFARSAARIAAAFGPGQVWSLRATREGNTVVVAARDAAPPERGELAARAATIEDRFGKLGLPARKWLRMVRPWKAGAEQA
jgi:spermidine synthase